MPNVLTETVPFVARRSMYAAAVGSRIWFIGGVGARTGGEAITDVSDELWRFDTRTGGWTQIDQGDDGQARPEPRRCPGWTSDGRNLFLWGGSGLGEDGQRGITFLNDVWRFEPDNERWTQLEVSERGGGEQPADDPRRARPGPRYTPVWARIGDRSFLATGYTEDPLGRRMLGDAWLESDGEWSMVESPEGGSPSPRYGCTFADDGERFVYVFGGASPGEDHADLWRFDADVRRWERLAGPGGESGAASPAGRYCGVMACCGGRVILFGGRSRWRPKENFNDLWIYDVDSRRWECVLEPTDEHRYGADANRPGYHAKCAHAVADDQLHILGGEGRRGHVSDFWRLDLSDMQWRMIAPGRADDPELW